ncbi:hypothetical protein A3N51_20025 [Enterobacter kobei]|nr:hypothetical protein A3N51_20025 [Enterobacter kobei]
MLLAVILPVKKSTMGMLITALTHIRYSRRSEASMLHETIMVILSGKNQEQLVLKSRMAHHFLLFQME